MTMHEDWHKAHPGYACEYDTCPRGQVLDLESATYTAAEVKVLTEAALRLGREEALEEVQPELDALRALWWFMNNDMGVCDGGDHAVLSWAEVTDMNDLHDAVEEIYQEHGYPPKPDATSGRTDPREVQS